MNKNTTDKLAETIKQICIIADDKNSSPGSDAFKICELAKRVLQDYEAEKGKKLASKDKLYELFYEEIWNGMSNDLAAKRCVDIAFNILEEKDRRILELEEEIISQHLTSESLKFIIQMQNDKLEEHAEEVKYNCQVNNLNPKTELEEQIKHLSKVYQLRVDETIKLKVQLKDSEIACDFELEQKDLKIDSLEKEIEKLNWILEERNRKVKNMASHISELNKELEFYKQHKQSGE